MVAYGSRGSTTEGGRTWRSTVYTVYDLIHIHLWSETVKCIIGNRIRNLERHAFFPGHKILQTESRPSVPEETAS